MIRFKALRLTTAIAAVASNGCAAGGAAFGPPPIPFRSGPLAIDVVYPRDSALITARDSNFIFGSVGNGNGELTINKQRVPVEANGAFLAWLPVPGGADDTLVDYELVARLGDEESRVVHTVRLPRPGPSLSDDVAQIDTASLRPRGAWWARAGELVPLRVRASAGARVRLLLPSGEAIPLHESDADSGDYRGEMAARSPLGRGARNPGLPAVAGDLSSGVIYCVPAVTAAADTTELSVSDAPPRSAEAEAEEEPSTIVEGRLNGPPECAVAEVATATDTTRVPLAFDLWIEEGPGPGPVVELREAPSGVGQDGFVVGRAAPGGTTLWMWVEGVRARVSGRRDDALRIRLDGVTEAWVAREEAVWLPEVVLPERARVGDVNITSRQDRIELRIRVTAPVPYAIDVDGRRFSVILYGVYSATDRVYYGPSDEFVREARWEQPSSDRYVLRVDLASVPWGHRARLERGALIVEIRKPPRGEAGGPLSGLTIAVDPGHPPAGSVGPTRLHEAEANLAIAFRVRRLLEAEGVRVLMTRVDSGTTRLYDRTWRAEILDADLLVSLHNNALADGTNPFAAHGTSAFYFHPHSLGLAEALQSALLKALGLDDLGIARASLALARPTWMPAVLTEGAFMMIPAQEAALRDPVFLEAYARGVVQGLRAFAAERRFEGHSTPNAEVE